MTSITHSHQLVLNDEHIATTPPHGENTPSRAEGRIRWVLGMIVKNESRTLPRLWASIEKYLDGWVICDTGSTDSTLDFLTHLKKHSPIPGTYHQHTWQDFGHNRSLSFTSAVEWAKENHPEWDLSNAFVLLLDADMVLKVVNEETDPRAVIAGLPGFSEEETKGCEFEQRQGGLHYANIRMLRMDCPWNCVGKTHEYWNFDGPHDFHKMMFAVPTDVLFIDDRGDGGARADKFERDERLLRAQLAETPDDSRTWFYLAQTLQDLGRWEDAHDAYLRRVALGGWDEERWMAMMRASNCSYTGSQDGKVNPDERQKLWAQCVREGLEAWAMRPHRSESIYRLAHWCRIKGLHQQAWGFIQLGRYIAHPHNDKLFVEPHAYADGWWDEISIIAYYIRHLVPEAEQEGIRALEKLLLRRYGGNIETSGGRRRDMARTNRRFYPFPTLYKSPKMLHQGEWSPSIPEWNACNPSAIPHPSGEGFIVAVRNVNYKIAHGCYVYLPDREECIDTATQIKHVKLERDEITDLWEVSEKSLGWIPELPEEERVQLRPEWNRVGRLPVWGYEDVRLFTHEQRVYFTATCLHIEGHMGTPRIVLGRLTEDFSGIEGEKAVPLRVWKKKQDGTEEEIFGWYGNGCEKNWLPFSQNNALRAVYSWEPLRLITVEDPTTGRCVIDETAESHAELDCGAWRGSTCPVWLKPDQETPSFGDVKPSAAFEPKSARMRRGRWGCMVHEVNNVSGKDVAREYYQRWVEFVIHSTGKMELVYVSELFVLTETTIEFPLGCIPTPNGWFISFGYKDGRARWCLTK